MLEALLRDFAIYLAVWLGMAAVGAALCAPLWLGRPRDRLLPAQRRRLVSWGGFEVVLVFVNQWAWAVLVLAVLLQTLGEPQSPDEEKLRAYLANAIALPLALVTSVLLLWRASGTRPYQLGLSLGRWRQDVLLGFLGWLVLTPIVLGLNLVVTWCVILVTKEVPKVHELSRLPSLGEPLLGWILLWVNAVAAAPLWEEFFFRGVVQRWLGSRRWGGHLAMAFLLAVPGVEAAVAFYRPDDRLGEFWKEHALFVLAVVVGYVGLLAALWRRGERRDAVGPVIYCTAALFAYYHPWPTEPAIFVLGLGLGWLAYRTQSLVGPIVLHALFNMLACLTAVFGPP
jgi:membrane protease YdiL (CAAX protease family)